MNIKRLRRRFELESVLKIQKANTSGESGENIDTDNPPKDPKKNLCPKAKRRLKIIRANEKFREMQEMARDNTVVQNKLIQSNILKTPYTSSETEGQDFVNTAILLYGISEGATGTIQDFDKILEALKNDTFLSRDFNLERELREYKLDKDGMPKYKGGGKGNVKPEDVAKAAKKFKLNAKLIKGAKVLGNVANAYGVVVTALESYNDGEITAVEAADILMGIIAFAPGYGWIMSGSYSAMRATTPFNAKFGIEMDNGIRRFGEW